MSGQVAIRECERVPEIPELSAVRFPQNREHAEPGSLVNDIVEALDRVRFFGAGMRHRAAAARRAQMAHRPAPANNSSASKIRLWAGATK